MTCVDLDDIKKVVTGFEADKNRAVYEYEHLQREISDFKTDISELQRINEKLCDELEENDRCIKKVQNENCRLEECLREKDMEVCHLQKLYEKVEELKAYIYQLECELENTSKMRCCLEDKITELSRCIQEKDLCIRRLENKLRNLEGMIRELEETIECLSDENRSLKSQLDECRQCLERTLEELECMCQRLKQCEGEKNMLECQVHEIQECLDNTNNTLQREYNFNVQLNEELKRLKEENQKLCVNNAYLKEEKCDLVKKLDYCNKNLQSCRCEHARVKQEFDAFKRSIGELKNQIISEIRSSAPNTPAHPVVSRRTRSINVASRKRRNRTRTPCSIGLNELGGCSAGKRPNEMNNNSFNFFVPEKLPKSFSFTLNMPKVGVEKGMICQNRRQRNIVKD